jgi:hypothetical protein
VAGVVHRVSEYSKSLSASFALIHFLTLMSLYFTSVESFNLMIFKCTYALRSRSPTLCLRVRALRRRNG